MVKSTTEFFKTFLLSIITLLSILVCLSRALIFINKVKIK